MNIIVGDGCEHRFLFEKLLDKWRMPGFKKYTGKCTSELLKFNNNQCPLVDKCNFYVFVKTSYAY